MVTQWLQKSMVKGENIVEWVQEVSKVILIPLFAYLLGSIPFGLILTKLFTSKDVRLQGSKNIGASNVLRVGGPTLALLTLLGDLLKGAVPVFFACSVAAINTSGGAIYISFVAFLSFCGHLYPVYLKFCDGGKGVATAAGCFLVICPVACIISLLVFIMVICFFNRASLGSLAATAVLPVAVSQSTDMKILTGLSVIIALLIFYRHKDNIYRLISGSETKIWK